MYKGATFNRKTGKWKAVITVSGKKMDLGDFDDAKTASDAYFAAKTVYADQQYKRKPRSGNSLEATVSTGGGNHGPASKSGKGTTLSQADDSMEEVAIPAMVIDLDASSSDDEASVPSTSSDNNSSSSSSASDRRVSAKYKGVIQEGPGATLWEAVVSVNGKEISGGEYDTEEEAARAYDALARMYLGEDATTNFPQDAYTSWVPPEQVAHTGQIEAKPGVALSLEEVMEALRQERGVNVAAVDLRGKSDLAEALVFVTGTSVAHMRRMADTISRAVSGYRGGDANVSVEALFTAV